MVLFIIKDSLPNNSIINLIRPKDKVLLIQDGVLMLNRTKSKALREFKEKSTEIIALKEDLELRGIKNNANINLIDYGEFVDLIESNKVFS